MSIYIFNIAIGSLDMFNLILGTDKKPPFMVSSHTLKGQTHLKMPNIYVSVSPITLLILFPLSIYNVLVFFVFFSGRLLSVLRGHSFFHPRHNGQ